MAHRRMEPLGEEEAEPAPVDHPRYLFAAEVDAGAERFEDIGAAAF
jgi:hypothetical protein